MKIAFRVDAGNLIGTGHLIETISLIRAIRKDARIRPIVVITKEGFAARKLAKNGIAKMCYIPGMISEMDEAKKVATLLKSEKCECLVINLKSRRKEYYEYLHNNLKKTFVVLDNYEHKHIPGSMVVNYSITQNKKFYEKIEGSGGKYLIGTDYFIMDSGLKKMKPGHISKDVKRIFVNQGGSDPFGLTAKILKAIDVIDFAGKVAVVLGGAMKKEDRGKVGKIRNKLRGSYEFYTDLPQKELYEIMRRSDMAISAAGNTLYELAYMGIPTLILSHHKEHDMVARAFEHRRAAINIGIGRAVGPAVIRRKVLDVMHNFALRADLHRKARMIVDGNGCDRISQEILKMCG